MRRTCIALLCLVVFSSGAPALSAPLDRHQVPDPLKPWVDWALHGHEDAACAPAFDQPNQRRCSWPQQLWLRLNDGGGTFALQSWQQAPAWLQLPGDGQRWPQHVRVDDHPAATVMHNSRPAVWISNPGQRRISGRFHWRGLPQTLPLPPAIGHLNLRINGLPQPQVYRERDGRLWLTRETADGQPKNDQLKLRVFRLIQDQVPLRVQTRLQLEVGGQARQVLIGPALLPGTIPVSLNSPLPARLEENGQLRLQLRPGVWTVQLDARSQDTLNSLSMANAEAPWPQQEIWSFRADPALRLVEVRGAPGLDPRQTDLPEAWKDLPAYLLRPQTELVLEQKQRGHRGAQADQLRLHRRMWLDFDGHGATFQDRINGEVPLRWRLDLHPPLSLGRAELDGEPQMITANEAAAGIELRRSHVRLIADSRGQGGRRNIPVSGWNAELQSVETELHLPPGWRLLAAPGADKAPAAWISQWTLLDLFVVLVTGIAAARVFGKATGLLTLGVLVLSWHEPGAPRFAWLNLIAVIALLRALPEAYRNSRLEAFVRRYQALSMLGLLLIALPFALLQVRAAFYPQLENEPMPGLATHSVDPAKPPPRMDAAIAPAAAPLEKISRLADKVDASAASTGYLQNPAASIDTAATTQTGPGVPRWHGNVTRLNWSGPITQAQTFSLWLMPPWLSRCLKLLNVLLLGLLIARWSLRQGAFQSRLRQMRSTAGAGGAALLLCVCAPLLLHSPPGLAESTAPAAAPTAPQPPPSLLDELRSRLLAPPPCMPRCAEIAAMQLDLEAQGQLQITLRVDAATQIGIPLPVPLLTDKADQPSWQAQSVTVDGERGVIRRDPDGSLWLRLDAGRHQVRIHGQLGSHARVELPLKLAPRQLQWRVSGWRISGAVRHPRPGQVIALERAQPQRMMMQTSYKTQPIPPLWLFSRHFELGRQWQILNELNRRGDHDAPAVLALPRLDQELVTGDAVRISGEQVLVSFAAGQRQLRWRSSLPVAHRLQLQSSTQPGVFEHWRFDIDASSNPTFSGLNAVAWEQDQQRRALFRPWPGESLSVELRKSEAIAGHTLTLEHSQLTLTPGKRVGRMVLQLDIRAGQARQHALPIPENLTVNALQVDGREQPPRIEQGALILSLSPGLQQITIDLEHASGLRMHQRFPRFDLGLAGVNAGFRLNVPADRWLLMTGGPRLGPAVQFWSVLALILILAIVLGRSRLTPLGPVAWALLGIGLSQLSPFGALVVVAWFLALSLRAQWVPGLSAPRFNLLQVGLAILTLASLALLFAAVAKGLLGHPQMQVAGYASTPHQLHWFDDRHDGVLATPWALNVSIWVYRGLMLLWALWMANSLISWLRWGWQRYTEHGLWKKRDNDPATTATPTNHT
ncbi:MAG: hypothetical protein ACPGZP_00880 [Panacagrimonas sp.]